MPFPILAAAIPGATLLLTLLMRKKGTAGPVTPTPAPKPAPGKRALPPVPWPDPLPATPFPATVIVPITATLPNGGIRVRTGPGTNFPDVAAQGAPGNDAFTGQTVTVMQTGVAPQDGGGGSWWQIMPASGGPGGFSRAMDKAGLQNFNVGGSGGGGGGADNGGDHGDDVQPDVVAGIWDPSGSAAWRNYRRAMSRRRRWFHTRMKG